MTDTYEMRLKLSKQGDAFKELEAMARAINPDLPADLSGHVLTISMSKDGSYAQATPAHHSTLTMLRRRS